MKDTARPTVRGWLVVPALAAGAFLTPIPPWVVDEFYSRTVYPWLQGLTTAVSNAAPVAFLDLLLVGAALLVVVRAGRLIGAMRRRGIVEACAEGGKRIVRAAALVALAFMLFWGFNYRRLPLETTLDGGVAARPSDSMLADAVAEAAKLAAALRPEALNDTRATTDELAAMLQVPMNAALVRLNREPLAQPGRPKTSYVLTPYFTAAGVDGMINPLALESIVHRDLLPFERPFVLAHEWAHLAGHGDEAEASAVGWFACMHGPPALAYSASLYLLMEGAAQLRGESRSRAFAQLDPGVRSDLEAVRQRLLRQQPRVRQASSKVYDQYLKANRVEDGTASYSRAVSVILSAPFRDALRNYSAGVGRNGRSSRAMPTSDSARRM